MAVMGLPSGCRAASQNNGDVHYPASEKTEIIRIVEQSHLPVRKTLEQIGIPRATFYRWHEQYQTGGPEAVEDRQSQPSRVWNRIPDDIRGQIIAMALEQPELSPRELAAQFTARSASLLTLLVALSCKILLQPSNW